MRTKNELYQEALRTIAARRQTARALAEDARAEAEAVIPALRHAEEEVRVRGIRCALAGASGKDRTAANAALTEAKQKLAVLLAASGRPADALEPKFTCKKCQDTGVVDGRTCSCVHKVMQTLRRKEIEGLSSLSISSFDTMKLSYYPNVIDPALGLNVRTYMGQLLAGLKDYAEDFSPAENESLMLVGNAGLGKTHAALAIAGIVLDGPIRDIDEIGKWDFPVYCTGTTPGGPYKEGPGEINVPIACGGVSVMPGDIILAEPGALIGFAGPRVIEQTIGEKLPAGFQRSEFQMEHGFVDQVVPRSQLRDTLIQVLQLHAGGKHE